MMRRSLVAALIVIVGCTGAEESQEQSLAREPSIAEQIDNHSVRLAEVWRQRQAELPQTFSDGLPGASELPPGWRPFRFNGLTFYVVPLN